MTKPTRYWIEGSERYPLLELCPEHSTTNTRYIELTPEEYEDFLSTMQKFEKWQDRIGKAYFSERLPGCADGR